MRKPLLIFATIFSLLIGVILGAGGMYYASQVVPEKKAQEVARQQQEKLNRMLRQGEIVKVKPDEVTVKVNDGGGDIGETVTVITNEYTSVQVGMAFMNKPGEKTNLTEWFAVGDHIDMLVEDGQALALYQEVG